MSDFYTSYTDGGSRSNPGPAAIGAVVFDPSGGVVKEISEYIGTATNNVAEYRALIAALQAAKAVGVDHIICHLDSEFVVKQMKGEYRVKSPDMKPLFAEALKWARQFSEIQFVHVRREQNTHADRLVNAALDALGYTKSGA